eukprot:800406-Pleurochrysis_carterae.AAC.1
MAGGVRRSCAGKPFRVSRADDLAPNHAPVSRRGSRSRRSCSLHTSENEGAMRTRLVMCGRASG